ncbi:MAG: TlpA disulfide reductase family protein [Verrucomicrobiota bacterium]|jgi:thiol-disulfide isomerase/thioredoxin
MRIPSLKSWLIFAAGFASCFTCIVALIFSAYYFWLKPMETKMLKQVHLSPPEFSTPQPAGFEFTAVGKNGTSLNFKDYRGRVVILNVWATWCMPCMAELPSLGKLAAHYSADKDVAVICLSQESANTIFKNRGALDSEAPIFSLSGYQLPGVYKTDGIPATFVIDTHGMIVFKHVGSADWSHPSVIKFIDSLRQRPNKSPEPIPINSIGTP